MNATKIAVLALLAGASAYAQTTILSDNYDVTGSGTGFGAGSGINSQITRLTGTEAAGMSYFAPVSARAANTSISGNKATITPGSSSGRFTFTKDGSTAFDFAPSMNISAASVSSPAIYDISISMANGLSGTQRFSLGFGTVESDANNWDFGVQVYRSGTAAVIQKRIDARSRSNTTPASATDLDINSAITTLATGTAGSELNFRLHVTDAGAETTTFNSRLQLYLNNSLLYDTATDAASLPSGWRLDGASRFISFDQAGTGTSTGNVTYDNFLISVVTPVPEPSSFAFLGLCGLAGLIWRRK